MDHNLAITHATNNPLLKVACCFKFPKVSSVRLAAYVSVAMCASAAITNAQPKSAPPKRQTNNTSGTKQMAGGDGMVGTIYTFSSNGFMINAKLTKVEYSVARFNVNGSTSVIPQAGEKVIILHWEVKNPTPKDEYLGRVVIPFSSVAADGETRVHSDYPRLANAKTEIAITLKPGQPLPAEMLSAGIIPAAGGINKLIIGYGRAGTKEEVTRYNFGKTPNIIKPLAATDADPADATGATAKKVITATLGTAYPLGYLDVSIDSVAFVTDAIGELKPEDGKRFLVATVTVTNRTWDKQYVKEFAEATLLTDDDEKTKDFTYYKGKRDEPADGRQVEPDEAATFRLVFVVPNKVGAKKLTLAEKIGNEGHVSRSLVLDLSAVK